jgi:hypothetical protein
LAREMVSMGLSKRLRYVPLLAAGVVVFLGLVFLGGLTGLLWHIRTFDWWVKLNPSVLGPTADWIVWGVCFLLTLCPVVVALVRRRVTPELAVVLTSLIFPTLSLITMTFSYSVGTILLVGSGFLAGYTLISRSPSLLGVEAGSALRMVSAEVFGFLSIMAAGGVISVLLWREDFFLALVSGSSLEPMDIWLSMLAVDLEAFYLARPFLSVILVILAVVAIVSLFGESFERIARWLVPRLTRRDSTHLPHPAAVRSKSVRQDWFPYLVLAGSMALGVAITLYPYLFEGFGGVLGFDSWFYIENLRSMRSYADVILLLPTGRALFLLLLFLIETATGLSAEWVVRLMPAILSVLLALSTFALVKEGTGRSWLAVFASVLSVVSAQTALGMAAGIITSWFALSVANVMFALIVRSIRLRSRVAAAGSLLFSFLLLGSYGFLWVVVIAELALVLLASILAFWTANRHEWRIEVVVIGGVLAASILIPLIVLFGVSMLGFRPEGIDPGVWFASAWDTITHVQPGLFGSVWGVLEEAFDFAGNRIDLPFLTILSIVGLLDHTSQRRSFTSILSAMVLVPTILTLIISVSSSSPYTPMWLTWRGLHVIPLYLTGALGVESIISRVNGSLSLRRSPSRLGFAIMFVVYVFLSHLSYSLRALELLMIVGSR